MSVSPNLWSDCLDVLRSEYTPQECRTWFDPLQDELRQDTLLLFAPNVFVIDWVNQNFKDRIDKLVFEISAGHCKSVVLQLGQNRREEEASKPVNGLIEQRSVQSFGGTSQSMPANAARPSNLNKLYTFQYYVIGENNNFANAAATRVAENPGTVYNPLLIYGGVGLGKTHLMHAVGNHILQQDPSANIVYQRSEGFVAHMVKSLQTNTMNEFKRYYRSLKVLMIDDIQFFADKDRSQEEFFHTFNALLEGEQQIILTCDRYPKEIEGIEERLRSRFAWGLMVAIDPPDLETRTAILLSKADQSQITLPHEVALFIAKRVSSNVRELEGALRRVIANAHFIGKPITIEFVKEALRDLFAVQDKLVTIDNIQKTVAKYYNIKVSELMSPRRNRSVTRPRQMAMYLAKKLTEHSLPEIGEAFGGRDHTTVIHAYRKVEALLEQDRKFMDEFNDLWNILTN